MAAVNITISGVLCDKYGRTITPCTIVGEATVTGLGVGGGPIVPPEGGEKPPGEPPGIWGGAIDPSPGHPLPEPPGKPPEPIQPPIDWKVVWHPTEGWIVVGVPNFPHPAPG